METKCRRNKATKLQQGCSSVALSLSLSLSCFGLPSRRYAESICSFSSEGKVYFTARRAAPVATSRSEGRTLKDGRTQTRTPLAALSYCALPPFNLCCVCVCVSLSLSLSYLCLSYPVLKFDFQKEENISSFSLCHSVITPASSYSYFRSSGSDRPLNGLAVKRPGR